MSKAIEKFNHVTYQGRTLRFSWPLVVTVERLEGDVVFIASENISVSAYGMTYKKALQAFKASLFEVWDNVACCKQPRKLAADALDVRTKMRAVVTEEYPKPNASAR